LQKYFDDAATPWLNKDTTCVRAPNALLLCFLGLCMLFAFIHQFGLTPLHWSAVDGHVALVDYLVAAGSSLKAADTVRAPCEHRRCLH
jgi:hypothetical protein